MADSNAAGQLALSELDTQLQKQKRKIKSVRQSGYKAWRVACAIFAICHPDAEPATTYIARSGNEFAGNEEEWRRQLRNWWEQCVAKGELQEHLHPRTKTGSMYHHVALKFLKEWRLHAWVEKVNLEKGIAPCSRVLVNPLGPPGIEPTAIPFAPNSTVRPKSKLQWLRRWRRRWHVEMGHTAAREHISDSEAQAKAGTAKGAFDHSLSLFGHPRRNPVPHFRFKMRTWFRARLMGFITQRCRKAASILGLVQTCFSLPAGCRDVELVEFFAHARGVRQNAVAHQHGRNSCPVLSEHKIWPAHARSAEEKEVAEILNDGRNSRPDASIHVIDLLRVR